MNDTAPPSAPPSLESLPLLKQFKEHLNRHPERIISPFAEDRVVRYHTRIDGHDVPEIHHEARQRIREMIREIHAGGQSQVVILVGNPGMGKSHLLNYFRQAEPARELGYVLVGNANQWRVGEFEECLLDWLLDALTRNNADGHDLLQGKVEDIAFQALRLILATPGQIARYLPRRRLGIRLGLLARLFSRSRGIDYERFQKALDDRDASIFRQLHFARFAGFVCDRFLAESGNPFQRYLLSVLLRYLFEEDREKAIHWLRRRPVEEGFLRRFGAKEEIDRHYKVFDAIKVLISLFSAEVAQGLAPPGEQARRGTVFLFAFDQIEGRDELFESEEDWFTFFAQLSELYNAMPNVFIVFTMTLKLRNVLHPKMEGQFRDRIRDDPRILLREVPDGEIAKLYEHRLHCWMKDNPALLESYKESGKRNFPFTPESVIGMGSTKRLREMLDDFDVQFRAYFEQLSIEVMGDYDFSLKEIRATEKVQGPVKYVKKHLETVRELLNHLGDSLAKRYSLDLNKVEDTQTKSGLEVLQIQFSDLDNSARWVRVFLVRLPYLGYMDSIAESVKLLSFRQKDRYHLWMVRQAPFGPDPEACWPGREDQVFWEELAPEIESRLRAVVRVWSRRDSYKADAWNNGEGFLLDIVEKSYLGQLFAGARKLLQGSVAQAAPDPEPDLEPFHRAEGVPVGTDDENGEEGHP